MQFTWKLKGNPNVTIVAFVLTALALLLSMLVNAASAKASDFNPGPVSNVSAVSGSGSLTVSWTAANPGGAEYLGPFTIREYQVRATKAGSYLDWRCTTSSTTCTINGLENGVDYWIEIKAYNNYYFNSTSTGNGPWKPCCSVPSSPGTVAATAADSSASVSWTGPTNSAAAGGGPFTYQVTSIPAAVSCSTQANNCDFASGLINGVDYTFYVSASSRFGAGPPGASNAVKPVGLPGSPSNVFAILSKGKAEVTWSAPLTDGGSTITRYVAQASPGGQVCESSGALSCQVAGLSNGKTYTFVVTAVTAVGSSVVSAPSASAKLLAGPGRPKSVIAKGYKSSASLRWKVPKSTGGSKISKYTVTVSPGGKTITTKKTSAKISGLKAGTTYTFVIRAFNSKGPGLSTSSKPIRTPNAPVTTPTIPTTPTPEPEKPTAELG